MKTEDLKYIKESLEYALNDYTPSPQMKEHHFNTFTNAIELIDKELEQEKKLISTKDIEIVNDWKDDLIWCPSQCYLDFKYKEREFVLYLRWRSSDPWSCKLCECLPNGKFEMINYDFEWIGIDIEFFKDKDNLNLIKYDAINKALKEIVKKAIEDKR